MALKKKNLTFLENIGKNQISRFKDLVYFSGFLKLVLVECITFPKNKNISFSVLVKQILFTGFEALLIICLIGLSIGGIIIIQGIGLLENFGQSELAYKILIIIISREVGPIITAIIIIARSGTAISTELGNMVVNKEIEALVSIGIDPVKYLVVPRVIGVIVSLFCLSLYFVLAGFFGGYLVAYFVQPIPFSDFISNLMQNMQLKDILIIPIKSISFGFIIGVISSFFGLKAESAYTEVPQYTIKSVVNCLVFMFIIDIIITIIFYLI